MRNYEIKIFSVFRDTLEKITTFATDFVHLHIENVIKKGGEIRLCETLATYRVSETRKGATFYSFLG